MTVLISSSLINKTPAPQPILFNGLLDAIKCGRSEIAESGVKTVMTFLDSKSRKLSDAEIAMMSRIGSDVVRRLQIALT